MVTTEITKKTRQMHKINQVTNAIISERIEHRQQQQKVFVYIDSLFWRFFYLNEQKQLLTCHGKTLAVY